MKVFPKSYKLTSVMLIFLVCCLACIHYNGLHSTKEIELASNENVLRKNILNSGKKSDLDDYNNLFNYVLNRVKASYVEDIDEKKLYEYALNGILSSLDPHSAYLNKEQYDELKDNTRGEFGGVGIEITKEFSLIKVISPIEGTPAYRAGIKSGDYISQIVGKSVVEMNLSEASKIMRGTPGTKVKLTVLRSGESDQLDFDITRENIAIKTTRSENYNDIIYIKINSFTEKAYQETLQNIISKTKEIGGEEQVKGIILDLRGNPGGLLDQSIKVSELFLPYGKDIVFTKGKNNLVLESFKSNNKKPLLGNKPMIVLINEGSASASEIVAGALQDNKKALIIGTKSYGKGSVQTLIPTPMYGAIKMTTARYYTPLGRSIQAKGIEPDITVKQNKFSVEKADKTYLLKEKDLKGHLENTGDVDDALTKKIKETTKKSNKNKSFEEIYEKDYQLARALDLLMSLSIFNAVSK